MSEAQLSVEPLFSTPLARFQVDDFVNTYIDLDFDREKDDQWFANPKQKNVWNHKSHDILAEEGYENLSKMVQSAVEAYLYDVLCYSKEIKAVRTSSWITIGDDGSATAEHLHTNSLYSGILYLKSLPKSGDLYFVTNDNPNYTSTTIKPTPVKFNIFNSSLQLPLCVMNYIFVFPSHLRHGVTPNTSGESRCALAFNYFVEGPISDDHTNYLYLKL